LLVAFFLAGLVVLGGLQQWWLQPLLAGMSDKVLFAGAVSLTALTDNAALTYLGSLVEGFCQRTICAGCRCSDRRWFNCGGECAESGGYAILKSNLKIRLSVHCGCCYRRCCRQRLPHFSF
jgi:hypothetical protein